MSGLVNVTNGTLRSEGCSEGRIHRTLLQGLPYETVEEFIMHDFTVQFIPDDAAATAGAAAVVVSTASAFFTTSFSTLSTAGGADASASGVAAGPVTDPCDASLSPYIIDV